MALNKFDPDFPPIYICHVMISLSHAGNIMAIQLYKVIRCWWSCIRQGQGLILMKYVFLVGEKTRPSHLEIWLDVMMVLIHLRERYGVSLDRTNCLTRQKTGRKIDNYRRGKSSLQPAGWNVELFLFSLHRLKITPCPVQCPVCCRYTYYCLTVILTPNNSHFTDYLKEITKEKFHGP